MSKKRVAGAGTPRRLANRGAPASGQLINGGGRESNIPKGLAGEDALPAVPPPRGRDLPARAIRLRYHRRMTRRGPLRAILRAAALAAGLFLLAALAIVATWMWRGGVEGGLVAAWRLLQNGPTTIDDFRLYPARVLEPAATPFPFGTRTRGVAEPPELEAAAGRRLSVSQLVSATETIALLVVKDDAIVLERYATGHGASTPSQYFSVTKSILATLVGLAVDDGIIGSIDQPVTDFVPELAPHGFAAVRLRHLADMRSGIDYAENDNPFGLHVLMNYTSDLPRLVREFRLRGTPGGKVEYKSGDTALLSLALQRALGKRPIADYAGARLWHALGMEHEAVWSLDREGGMEKAWCCLAGSARDLAKIGRLHLGRGRVAGRRVLDERWVDEATRALAPAPAGAWGYAFSWWRPEREGGEYLASGKDGQFLFIDPARNVVVVRLGRSDGDLAMGAWTAVFRSLARHAW